MILVLFGVSGAGKTTIGTLLSARLGWCFVDGDDYHSLANRQKMESGTPLTDEDREPWLNALHARMREFIDANENAILACSALKQKYRDLLVAGFAPGQVSFALLEAGRDLLEERVHQRQHQYMNPDLLGSQLATLETPADAWHVSVTGTPEQAVQQLLGHLNTFSERYSQSNHRANKESAGMTTTSLSLTGKTAVIIGGTSGIGRALSLGLAEAGADVVASARRQENVGQVATEVEARGRHTLRVLTDISDRKSLEQLAAAVLKRFAKIDILINCAAKIKRIPTLAMTESDWQDILDTNLTGTFRACQVFGKHMLERGYGRIINIASLNTFVALTEVAAYAASKAGVASLTRSLAVEWSKNGVLVNAIAPGVFRTDLNKDLLDNAPRGKELLMRTPMGRFGQTEELIGAAVYLASDAASFVTGQVLVVDGGFLASGVNQ